MKIPVSTCKPLPLTFPPSDCAEHRVSILITIANGTEFSEGDEIHYVITVANTGDVILQRIVVSNSLDDTTWEFGVFELGDSETIDFYHTVTEEEASKPSLTCTATAVATIIPNINIRKKSSVNAIIVEGES